MSYSRNGTSAGVEENFNRIWTYQDNIGKVVAHHAFKAGIYIEHNLAHVHEVADRLVILDRGAIVAEKSPKDMSVTELTEFLIALQHKT